MYLIENASNVKRVLFYVFSCCYRRMKHVFLFFCSLLNWYFTTRPYGNRWRYLNCSDCRCNDIILHRTERAQPLMSRWVSRVATWQTNRVLLSNDLLQFSLEMKLFQLHAFKRAAAAAVSFATWMRFYSHRLAAVFGSSTRSSCNFGI